jgi:hypothetical protein
LRRLGRTKLWESLAFVDEANEYDEDTDKDSDDEVVEELELVAASDESGDGSSLLTATDGLDCGGSIDVC